MNHEAVHDQMKRRAAIKILHSGLRTTDRLVTRF